MPKFKCVLCIPFDALVVFEFPRLNSFHSSVDHFVVVIDSNYLLTQAIDALRDPPITAVKVFGPAQNNTTSHFPKEPLNRASHNPQVPMMACNMINFHSESLKFQNTCQKPRRTERKSP
jgi:hypothetical protein